MTATPTCPLCGSSLRATEQTYSDLPLPLVCTNPSCRHRTGGYIQAWLERGWEALDKRLKAIEKTLNIGACPPHRAKGVRRAHRWAAGS